jgi:uncharacterized repeat protein (TIGR01451 family)
VQNPVPAITSLSPSTLTVGATATTVTINGSGFIQSSAAQWNQANRTTTYVSSTQLTVQLTASDLAAIATGKIVVVNPAPGGGTSNAQSLAIVYPVPVLTSLSPSSMAWNSLPATLTVTGSAFEASSVVQLNGVNHATTYVNSTTLTLTLSASDLGTAATLPVTVFTGTPGGGTSSATALTITYPLPSITSISPSSLTVNSPDTSMSIQGAGFTSSTTVQVNGSTLATGGWTPNQLLVTLPATDLTSVGTLSITVSNPGTAASNALTLTVMPYPVPVLSSISPGSAAVGGADFTLTLYGSNFAPASVVQWNGTARPTAFVDNSQLTATISAGDIVSLGNNSVTVFNPTPGGGLSAASPFTTYLALAANALVYNPATQLLYASVPSSGGAALGNSIVPIDPYTGNLGTPIFVGSEPNKLALSSDGSTLWVSLDGAAAIREVDLNAGTAGLQFSLGGGTGIYNPPYTAQALAVMPGFPNTIAVATPVAYLYSSTVTIYDSGVPRINSATGTTQCCSGITGLAFDPTGASLYEAGSGYGVATVDSTGITSSTLLNASVSTNALVVDSGQAYLTTGVVLDANTGTQLGVFSVSPGQNANGPVAPDSVIGEAFILWNSSLGSGYQINAYDLSTFVAKGDFPVGGVNSFNQNPSSLIRWGQDGLAFTTGTQVYILRSLLVRDLSTTLADLGVTASVETTAMTGASLTYTLTVNNAGPNTASPATLIDTLPANSTLQSVTPSHGNCSGGTVINCNLGDLNSGATATLKITITPLVAGTLTNTAVVSAPQGDPELANNTAVSTTVASGGAYHAVPVVTSVSPSFVQAGSGALTLTVNGSGFSSDSTVQMNSTALPTTFVSSSQLTASITADAVAALGWAWIYVTSPSPGGGTSSNLPVTIYQVISLDINRLDFDPYTRKLYATIPSTATQVAGNSLLAIDPTSGSLGTPLNVGSEPNRVSETSDGQDLYIGLDGSESLTFVDLTTLTQGPVYPITFGSSATPTQVAARDLAVAPGDDNLLAIDTGADNGIGLFDISGSTGTMRVNLTGAYTGSNLAFANGATLYSYDSDTTGAEFNRWTVTSTGLTLNNNTGYTMDGIGGFAGSYELVNNIVYGFAGGVFDPTPTPPLQMGQFAVSSAQGSAQSIEGSGVAACPSYGRVFFLGETTAGTANPLLLSYDSNHYVLLNMTQFTGSAQGQDLLRWGRDGLAWHSSLGGPFGTSTPGAGQLFLMQGPFVLPQWSMSNSTPGLTSVAPANATAGSGNFTLAVTGSGFVPGAVLKWNGAERTTTYVDSSHLQVAIPAADVIQSGTATLVVNNPGSSDSSSVSFTIN